MRRLALCAAVVLVGAGYVEGAIIVGHFHGTIYRSRVWENTFGLPEGIDTINGMEISGNIAYDTALAPSDKIPQYPLHGVYQTVDDSVTWMQLNPVTIGGTLITIPPFPDPIVERDADQMFQVSVPTTRYTPHVEQLASEEHQNHAIDSMLPSRLLS